MKKKTARHLATRKSQLHTASETPMVFNSASNNKGTREIPELVRQFIISPKKHYRRPRVLVGFKPKLTRIIEEQSETGHIENLRRHELDGTIRGTLGAANT